ncbi:hypothetical protein ACFE04_014173 [Oxalis oulophora]
MLIIIRQYLIFAGNVDSLSRLRLGDAEVAGDDLTSKETSLENIMKVLKEIAVEKNRMLVLHQSLSTVVYTGIAWFMMESIPNLYDPSNLSKGSPWTCPTAKGIIVDGCPVF